MFLKLRSKANENCNRRVEKIDRLLDLVKKEPEEKFKKKTRLMSKMFSLESFGSKDFGLVGL